MKEKIHDLKTALEVLRIQQTVSFDDCQKLMTDVHDKTGFTPPNFEISGNQWCVLVNLAISRFGSTTPQPEQSGFFSREAMKAHSDCNMTRLENTEQNQWSSLTKEERGEFVQRICNTGTMFVTPLFSIINEIEWLIWERNK